MIASQFLMQKMTPQATGDPNQQRMMMFMPLIFGFMFYNFASGLVSILLDQQFGEYRAAVVLQPYRAGGCGRDAVALPKKKNGRK